MEQTHICTEGMAIFISLHFYAVYEGLLNESQDTLLDCVYKYPILDFVSLSYGNVLRENMSISAKVDKITAIVFCTWWIVTNILHC